MERSRSYLPYLIPAIAVLFTLTIYPFLYTIYFSFFRYDLTLPKDVPFIGFDNYIEILVYDPLFWNSVLLTLEFLVFTVSISLLIGVLVALVADRVRKFESVVRLCLLLPMIVPPIVSATIFRHLMYHPIMGYANYFLIMLGLPSQAWLGDPNLALFAVGVVDIWQWTPFVALIGLAGLKALPVEPHEAAQIDGATELQILRHITLPMLKPTILLALVFRTMDSLKVLDILFGMARGGPGFSTETLTIYAFLTGLHGGNHIGYASALVAILLVISLFLSSRLIKLLRPR